MDVFNSDEDRTEVIYSTCSIYFLFLANANDLPIYLFPQYISLSPFCPLYFWSSSCPFSLSGPCLPKLLCLIRSWVTWFCLVSWSLIFHPSTFSIRDDTYFHLSHPCSCMYVPSYVAHWRLQHACLFWALTFLVSLSLCVGRHCRCCLPERRSLV